MKYVEDDEDYVEVMCVKKELKEFSPNSGSGCNPQEQTSNQRYRSSQI
jgi:hypothetical protein